MSHRKAQNLEIDNLDIQILSILMKNATTPYTEIAKELIVSAQLKVYVKARIDPVCLCPAAFETGIIEPV